MTEKEFQSRVLVEAELSGWDLAYHTYDSRRSQPGFPDLVLVKRGWRTVFVELKSDKGRLRPAQREWLDGLTSTGEIACLWRPAMSDEIIEWLIAPYTEPPGLWAAQKGQGGTE